MLRARLPVRERLVVPVGHDDEIGLEGLRRAVDLRDVGDPDAHRDLGRGRQAGARRLGGERDRGYRGISDEKLRDSLSPSGAKVKQRMAPDFTRTECDSGILEKTILDPATQGTDQVNAATLTAITDNLDEALRRELTGIVKFATEPGAKTLRFKTAITAAASDRQNLKPHQLIPVALVVAMARRAVGDAPQQAKLAVEFMALDPQTGNQEAVGVREGTAALASPPAVVSLATLKPVLDAWAKDARMFFRPSRRPARRVR